jgi:hypothetical protein
MLIRKPLFLLLSLIFLFGCKKDEKSTYIYKGIVLHAPDNAPIAGAQVKFELAKRGTRILEYSTRTNDKGEFAFSVYDTVNTEYRLRAYQSDMIEASFNEIHSSVGNDTLFLQHPNYLRIIVNINHAPPANQAYHLYWRAYSDIYYNPDPVSFTLFPTTDRYYVDPKTTDTLSEPYSGRLYKKASVTLAHGNQGNETILVYKEFKTDTLTSDVLIEY